MELDIYTKKNIREICKNLRLELISIYPIKDKFMKMAREEGETVKGENYKFVTDSIEDFEEQVKSSIEMLKTRLDLI